MTDKFSDAPSIRSYFHLWGKHEFDLTTQRNILLHFLADKGLDDQFIDYLDFHFPEDEDGVRLPREELIAKVDLLKKKLGE